ncbi:protein ABHD11-like [Biomphalaria glabrata]|uniref:sn-1-specific diacylglycerol lipase ABHD11 n=1 Tax=Biomphalaria glabrata TaxID=6526 RepID=A0A9W2YI36_BIOGL|nr:protein ABHD11-like [Biomphalaria glabrata]
MEIRSRLSLSCFYRVFRNCKQWHKKHSCSLQNRHSHRQLSSESGDVDLELSYTTYPDQEHSQVSTKKPLLFVHGLFGAKGNLHSVSKHLSNDGQKVVTYDARNHGDSQHSPKMDYISMADDLDGLITDLSLKDPVVMGHSMGGKTAMTLALTKPERMSALIVVDITPSTNDTRELYKYAQAMKNVQIPSGVSIIQARKNVEAQLSAVVTNRAVLQFLLTNLREFPSGELRWRMNLNAIINNFDKITQFPDLSSKQFIKPTLFIFGANSPHYRSVQMDVIKSFFPQVQVTVIKEAAHFVHADKPLEFVAAVKTFLSSIEESAV